MKIILRKIKRTNDYERKISRNNVKEGLKELKDDFNNGAITIKGDKHTLTFVTNDARKIEYIIMIANNYAIPYIISH